MKGIPLTLLLIIYTLSSLYAQEEVIDEKDYNLSIELSNRGWDYLTAKDYQNAVKHFDQSIALFDGDANALLGRASALSHLGQLERAESDVQQVLDMSNGQADIYYLAGNVYYKMEFYEKAISYYNKALNANETSSVKVDSTNCYYNRANAFFGAKMYRSAINDFTKVIDHKSDFYNAYHNRALAYKHRSMMKEACQDFKKAKELGSFSSDKYINRYCDE